MTTHLTHWGITGEAVEVYGPLVGQVVKDVEGSHCLGPALLVAKNKVNPLVQLTRYKLAFQGLSKRAGQLEVKGTHTQHETHVRRKHTHARTNTLEDMFPVLEGCNSRETNT